MNYKTEISNVAKGALAGAIGGVLGALAMSSFAELRSKLTHKGYNTSLPELSHPAAGRFVNGSNLELDSIALAADRIDRLTGGKMSPRQKSLAAAGVHFGIGALLGSVYGAAAEKSELVTRGYGVAFATLEAGTGNLAWTAATKSFSHYSAADQAESIMDHAVYGLVLDAIRRLLRKTA